MPLSGDLYYFASRQNGDDRPVIILIHGAGGTHMHWPYNLRRINQHRVLAPDLPGHGKSAGLGKQSICKYAESIIAWMDSIGVKKALFGGHSMGGAIAQTIALHYPEKVQGLILVATGPKLTVNQELLVLLSTPSTTSAAIDKVIKWSWPPDTDQKLLEKVREQMMATRSAVIYGDYLACNNFDLSGRLHQIKVPTLVIVGDQDKMTPLYLNEQLKDEIKKAEMAVIPNGGHMVMLEQPKAVAGKVFEFVQSLPS